MSRLNTLCFETCYQLKFDTIIRGQHVYKSICTPVENEKLQSFKDPRDEAKEYDKYAIGVYLEVPVKGIEEKKNNILVEHLPMEISQTIYHFLNTNNKLWASPTGERKRVIGLVVLTICRTNNQSSCGGSPSSRVRGTC